MIGSIYDRGPDAPLCDLEPEPELRCTLWFDDDERIVPPCGRVTTMRCQECGEPTCQEHAVVDGRAIRCRPCHVLYLDAEIAAGAEALAEALEDAA